MSAMDPGPLHISDVQLGSHVGFLELEQERAVSNYIYFPLDLLPLSGLHCLPSIVDAPVFLKFDTPRLIDIHGGSQERVDGDEGRRRKSFHQNVNT